MRARADEMARLLARATPSSRTRRGLSSLSSLPAVAAVMGAVAVGGVGIALGLDAERTGVALPDMPDVPAEQTPVPETGEGTGTAEAVSPTANTGVVEALEPEAGGARVASPSSVAAEAARPPRPAAEGDHTDVATAEHHVADPLDAGRADDRHVVAHPALDVVPPSHHPLRRAGRVGPGVRGRRARAGRPRGRPGRRIRVRRRGRHRGLRPVRRRTARPPRPTGGEITGNGRRATTGDAAVRPCHPMGAGPHPAHRAWPYADRTNTRQSGPARDAE